MAYDGFHFGFEEGMAQRVVAKAAELVHERTTTLYPAAEVLLGSGAGGFGEVASGKAFFGHEATAER